MALDGTIVWEVQTGGDDANGGGYSSDDGGTDYSQQAAAQLSLTDLATSGIGVTTLTSVVGGFTAAMIDNLIQIVSGTNVTAGFYRITAHTDTNTVTLDRAPDDGVGGISSGVGKVGGALGSPGMAAKAMEDAAATGQETWVKAGTYVLTTTTPGADGPISLSGGSKAYKIEGYLTTRGDRGAVPILDAGALTSFTMVDLNGDHNGPKYTVSLKVDGKGNTAVRGFDSGNTSGDQLLECVAVNCLDRGFLGNSVSTRFVRCEASSNNIGFDLGRCVGCVSHDNSSHGFIGNNTAAYVDCIAYGNGGRGFSLAWKMTITSCTAYNNTDDGFWSQYNADAYTNCLAYGNGGYGFGGSKAWNMYVSCTAFNNTSGQWETTPRANFDEGTITGDPFVSVAGADFRPDDTANEGAVLRGGGAGPVGQTNNADIGAVQHADPAGGGGGLLTHPGMSGGMRG